MTQANDVLATITEPQMDWDAFAFIDDIDETGEEELEEAVVEENGKKHENSVLLAVEMQGRKSPTPRTLFAFIYKK